jgi:mRNA interferase MazF
VPENNIKRGEIYFAYLDPAFGRELGGYKARPVVVISINVLHQDTRLVTVVPGTSTRPKFRLRNVVEVASDQSNRLPETTYFMCHQIRALDQGRFTSQAIGLLRSADVRRIEDAVCYAMGMPGPTP